MLFRRQTAFPGRIKIKVQGEPQRVFQRMLLLKRDQVREVKAEYAVAQTGPHRNKLTVALALVFIEKPGAQ